MMSNQEVLKAISQSEYPALENESPNYETGISREISNGGNANPIAVPYVTAGNVSTLDNLKSALGETASEQFGEMIKKVDVTLLDSSKKIVVKNNQLPSYAYVSITLKGVSAPAQFQTQLKKSGGQLVALDVVQSKTATNPMSLNLACSTLSCSEIVMVLAKNATTKAGIIYRTSTPSVLFRKDPEVKSYSSAAMNNLDSQSKRLTATRVSVTVYPGISYSDIEIQNPTKENVLAVSTDELDTQEVSPQVSKVKSSVASGLTCSLYGNDPSTGSLIFDCSMPKSSQQLFIYINEPKHPETSAAVSQVLPGAHLQTPPPGPANTNPNNSGAAQPPSTPAASSGNSAPQLSRDGLFLTPDPQQNPNGYQMTLGFARYQSNWYVRRVMAAWLGHGQMPSCQPDGGFQKLLDFMTYAPVIVHYIEAVTNAVGVSPDIGYLLALEGSYGSNPQYKGSFINNWSSATGPWQIENGAAEDASKQAAIDLDGAFGGFKFLNAVYYHGVRKPSPRDDRTYLLNSTAMASYYIKFLIKQYKLRDPALAIMAYNAGGGTVNKAQGSVDPYQNIDTSLGEILRYRIRTKKYCPSIAYASEFLALRAIGQHPGKYNLHIAPAQTKAFKYSLKNPYSKLPPNVRASLPKLQSI